MRYAFLGIFRKNARNGSEAVITVCYVYSIKMSGMSVNPYLIMSVFCS